MSDESKDMTIAALVHQIDANDNRIGTLLAENARLTRDLAAAQIQRDTALAQVSHNDRRGW